MPAKNFKTVTLQSVIVEQVEKVVRPKYDSVASFIDEAVKEKLEREKKEPSNEE